jgi:hypothetical protein
VMLRKPRQREAPRHSMPDPHLLFDEAVSSFNASVTPVPVEEREQERIRLQHVLDSRLNTVSAQQPADESVIGWTRNS